MAKSNIHFDLIEEFAQPGCAVCRLVLRAVDKDIESINYEFVNDPGFRKEVETDWGFCNLHAHQWLTETHPLATALIYKGVLDQLETAMQRIDGGSFSGRLANFTSHLGSGGSMHRRNNLSSERGCHFCNIRAESEHLVSDRLIEGLLDPDFQDAFLASSGLCVPHLTISLRACPDTVRLDLLRTHTLARAAALRQELQEIIHKHDYRFHDLPVGTEFDATQQVVHQIAGSLGIADRTIGPG